MEMDEMKSISGMKAILVLLYSKGISGRLHEEIVGRTKLEKLLFLLGREGLPLADYEFEACDFGPCSDRMYDDIEVLEGYGWIGSKPWEYENVIEALDFEDHREKEEESIKVEIFFLTEDKGIEKGKKAFLSLSSQHQEIVTRVKKEFNSKSLMEILRYVYEKYPEFAEKSRIRSKVLAPSKFGAVKDIPSFVREGES